MIDIWIFTFSLQNFFFSAVSCVKKKYYVLCFIFTNKKFKALTDYTKPFLLIYLKSWLRSVIMKMKITGKARIKPSSWTKITKARANQKNAKILSQAFLFDVSVPIEIRCSITACAISLLRIIFLSNYKTFF